MACVGCKFQPHRGYSAICEKQCAALNIISPFQVLDQFLSLKQYTTSRTKSSIHEGSLTIYGTEEIAADRNKGTTATTMSQNGIKHSHNQNGSSPKNGRNRQNGVHYNGRSHKRQSGANQIKGIKYVAPTGTTGYANAALDYMYGLCHRNISVTWKPLQFDYTPIPNDQRGKVCRSLIDKDIAYNVVMMHSTPEHWLGIIEAETRKNGNDIDAFIGITVWETDKLHPDFARYVNHVDQVIVPCHWNKKVFQESGVHVPVEVIPHVKKEISGVDGHIEGIGDQDFVFYAIGDWVARKGMDDTLTAYLNTFSGDDNTALVLKTHLGFYTEDDKKFIRDRVQSIVAQYSNPAKAVLLLDHYDAHQIALLHQRGDCYFHLCKGEGFGLGAFEASTAGNPVIITGWGGQNEFLLSDHTYFVDYKIVPVEGMPWVRWYENDQHWAKPAIDHASKLLEKVYQNQSDAKRNGVHLKNYINNYFDDNTLIPQLIDKIEDVATRKLHLQA